MRNFGEIPMSCLSSIHFFGNFYPYHWTLEVGIGSKASGEETLSDVESRISSGNFKNFVHILGGASSSYWQHSWSMHAGIFHVLSSNLNKVRSGYVLFQKPNDLDNNLINIVSVQKKLIFW
jgi:hypothetical protein